MPTNPEPPVSQPQGEAVIVPRVPTRAMWAAGGNVIVGYKQRHHDKVVADVWSAMLAAARTDHPVGRAAVLGEAAIDMGAFVAGETGGGDG